MPGELPEPWLSRDPLPGDPLPILKRWLDEAFAAGLQQNPHAMALATIDPGGAPSVRFVLCNEIDALNGTLTFYTNRESRKGRALAANPRAAAVFYWGPQSRQARVEGPVTQTSDAASDAYFASRPADAQIGAWASAQSEPIASRSALLEKIDRECRRHGATMGDAPTALVPRPPSWGGYVLHTESVELWVSRPARIHDRALWTRTKGLEDEARGANDWSVTRLQP